MPMFVCLRPIAERPNGLGFYEIEKWDIQTSESLNEPFVYGEGLEEALDGAKAYALFDYCVQVTDADVDEEGYISISLSKEFTLETEDIRDKIRTPDGVFPQECEYFIIAENDEKFFWCVVYPSR